MVNYKIVKDEIDKLSNMHNRKITLVSVSKTYNYENIMDAYNQGARIFGENRVQEIEEKFPQAKPKDMKIYLIGHLQSNKVKKAVALVDRIESVDSIKILDKINSEANKINKKIEILFEYNVSLDENKSGFISEDDIFNAIDYSKGLANIKVIGIMCIGPLGFDEEKNALAFSKAKILFDKTALEVLSMGMSADYLQAIDMGSTEVRIGTTIFGQREYL